MVSGIATASLSSRRAYTNMRSFTGTKKIFFDLGGIFGSVLLLSYPQTQYPDPQHGQIPLTTI
jgi:hypothetical protein